MAGGLGASFVPAGTTPAAICRARVSSRILSQPWSNLPFHFWVHDCGTWCGACVAPGAKYTNVGLSGARAFVCLIQARAFSVMSVMKW